MFIEPYPYKIGQENRKVFKIDKNSNKELFETYYKSYQKMWNDSIDA